MLNRQLRSSTSAEIQNLNRDFRSTSQTLPPGVSAEDLSPDEPPPSYIVEGFQYIVSGAAYLEDDGHHFQIWLWDMLEPALIYTDEMVFEEAGNEYLPLIPLPGILPLRPGGNTTSRCRTLLCLLLSLKTAA